MLYFVRYRITLVGIALSIFLLLSPLIFVNFSIPKAEREGDRGITGRVSNVSDIAVIHNYTKEGRRVAVVRSPIRYIPDNLKHEFKFVSVPAGFKTDFASLPSFARLFFSPFGKYAEAAIVHDWFYAIGEPGRKKDADIILYNQMIEDGVSPVVAAYFYTAVRLGTHFNNGGYGVDTEWTEAFYSIDLQSDIPEQCVPSKPKSALIDVKTSDIPEAPPLSSGFWTMTAALSAEGYDLLMADWAEIYKLEACRVQLPDMVTRAREEKFGGLISELKKDFSKIGIDADLAQERLNDFESLHENNIVLSQLQAQGNSTIISSIVTSAYIQEKSGTKLTDEFSCLHPIYQFGYLASAYNSFENDYDLWLDYECPDLTWTHLIDFAERCDKSIDNSPQFGRTICRCISNHLADEFESVQIQELANFDAGDAFFERVLQYIRDTDSRKVDATLDAIEACQLSLWADVE